MSCDRCRQLSPDPLIPWGAERLCWPCADRQLDQTASDMAWFVPFGIWRGTVAFADGRDRGRSGRGILLDPHPGMAVAA